MGIVTQVGRDDSDANYAMVNVGRVALLAGGQPIDPSHPLIAAATTLSNGI
jgi:hypothetical protein